MPRILLLVPDLHHTGPTYNALTLGRALSQSGSDVLVAALDGGDRESGFAASAIPFLIEPHLNGWIRGRPARGRIRAFRPDVVHALDLSLAPLARRLARLADAAHVVTVNHPVTEEDAPRLAHPRTPYIAVSDAVHAGLVHHPRITRDRVRVIHNGVDLSRFRPVDETTRIPDPAAENRWPHTPVVGALGALRRDKGQPAFLAAAARVLAARPEVEFVVMGRGPDLPALKELATGLHISHRVTFTSGTAFATSLHRKRDDSLEAVYLRDFDVFVEPSRREGLGLSVLQAMAWGRPVVASGVGGLYSLVEDGVTGVLVPKDDPDALAAALLDILSDPARAEEMGRRGRERIEAEFDIRTIAKQHVALYKDLAAQAAGDAAG